jgi:hypothetical protein
MTNQQGEGHKTVGGILRMSGKFEIGKFYSVPLFSSQQNAAENAAKLVALTTERSYTHGRLRLQQ